MMHAWLVGVLVSVLKDEGVPTMTVVTKAKGHRATDASKHEDVDVLDFFAEGHRLVVDVVVTIVYRNAIFKHEALVPGYTAKHAKDRKFQDDRASTQLIAAMHGGPHILVPFAMEM